MPLEEPQSSTANPSASGPEHVRLILDSFQEIIREGKFTIKEGGSKVKKF